MLQVETTTIMDATKYLGCSSCVLNCDCKGYILACNFTNVKMYFAAKAICILECAEKATAEMLTFCKKEKLPFSWERCQEFYKNFLPALNDYLQAFYKYECENAPEYDKQAFIFYIAEHLEYWGLLKDFDFIYSQDIENTRDILQAQFKYEITKSENKKLATEKAETNNTTKGE